MLVAALSALAGYILGSIPTAIWVGKLAGGIDVRQHGSGNAGATNVARVLGIGWGLLVGAVDILKGLAPVLILGPIVTKGSGVSPGVGGLAVGAAAIMGHVFPIFAGFKGGKGVLTALGVFLGLLPFEAALAMAVWLVVFATVRIVSLGSLTAVTVFAAAAVTRWIGFDTDHDPVLVIAACAVTLLVFVTHRQNIRRLMSGTEPRFHRS